MQDLEQELAKKMKAAHIQKATERISVKVTPFQYDLIGVYSETLGYETVADFIRDAISSHCAQNHLIYPNMPIKRGQPKKTKE